MPRSPHLHPVPASVDFEGRWHWSGDSFSNCRSIFRHTLTAGIISARSFTRKFRTTLDLLCVPSWFGQLSAMVPVKLSRHLRSMHGGVVGRYTVRSVCSWNGQRFFDLLQSLISSGPDDPPLRRRGLSGGVRRAARALAVSDRLPGWRTTLLPTAWIREIKALSARRHLSRFFARSGWIKKSTMNGHLVVASLLCRMAEVLLLSCRAIDTQRAMGEMSSRPFCRGLRQPCRGGTAQLAERSGKIRKFLSFGQYGIASSRDGHDRTRSERGGPGPLRSEAPVTSRFTLQISS